MARRTNGTNQWLQTASSLSFPAAKMAVQMWLWVDAFGTDDANAAELSIDFEANRGFVLSPNFGAGFLAAHVVDVGGNFETFPKPSSSAWHHYVVNFDIGGAATDEIVSAYVDGVNQTLTPEPASQDNNTASARYNSNVLYLMSHAGTSRFLPGRIAELAIWSINLNQTDVDALWNNGAGAIALTVQSGGLAHYWRLIGDTSPEPSSVLGSTTLTVNGGAPWVAHPFGAHPSRWTSAP